MKRDFVTKLRRVSQGMLIAGTRAGEKAGDVAHEAMRQWVSIWDRVLAESGFCPTSHDSKPDREQIAARAYEIWKSKGCPQDTSEEDWKQAERQLIAR
jgi:DUF2934 family protein